MKKINFKLNFSKKENRVVTLFNDYMFVYENGRVIKEEKSFTKSVISTVLNFKNVYNLSFKLSKALSEEELLVEAEKYVYSQEILDLSKEYKIIYNFQKYDEFYYVDAFAVEVENLKSLMGDYLKEFKYIDFISFSPFVFKEYYDLANITPGVDVFIYFGKEDSYIVGYNKGEFVFVRSLDKLTVLEKELNKTADEIIELLKAKGLNKDRYEDDYTYEIIDTFFSKFFMKVSNVINYSVNFFKLNKIDKMFFYAPFNIVSLQEAYEDFWSMSNIDFKKLSLNVDYDPFEYTVAFYNAKYYKNENLNFSVFLRPPPFYKRPSGNLIFLLLGGILLIGLDASYKEYKISNFEKEKLILSLHYSTYKNKLDLAKRQIKFYNKNIKLLNVKFKKLSKEADVIYENIEKLSSMYEQPLFTNQYAKIVSLLEKYNLKINEFHKTKNSFSITVLSSQQNYNKIPLFLKNLRQIGFSNINFKNIENNSTSYKTKVFFDD